MVHTYVHMSGYPEARLAVPWMWNVHAESDSSLHNEHLKLSTRCGPNCPTCYIYICLKVGERDMRERTTLGGWERRGGADGNSLVLFSGDAGVCGVRAPRLGFCGTWMMQKLPHACALPPRSHGDAPLGPRRWSVHLGEGV